MKKRIYSIYIVLFLITFFGETKGQDTIITTSDGVKLFASIRGDGIPCLFVHGGPGQGSNYWQSLAGDISENHFKMIYLDQRGCGRSESPSDSNYNIDRMIQDFEEVRDYLGIKEWMIMGHSFGGVLQTYYAYKHPEVIRGILMFNCTLDLYESLEESYIPAVIAFFDIDDSAYFSNTNLPISERLDSIQKLFTTKTDVWKLSFSSVESAMKFGQTYAGFDTWNMDFSKAVFTIDDYNKDYSQITPDINIPTLFLYSSNDENVGVNHYKKIKFPHMKLVKVDGSHMGFIDKEEEYKTAIDAFLNQYY
ncbi:MAG TPA: alpha/beta hydrolase [Salinivirga sp.]|uniref:alpha/beta fold hydrolase n=1 Tax=Salinivirga sp. TaxID=1970192 RepID=UPI002B47EEBA|nr:alpha/beta hydrolase [Salinivirga sp.]HKK60403.1 alpha/beta hydrolase [Salinivirga sp.]